jgi:hypothetical protein
MVEFIRRQCYIGDKKATLIEKEGEGEYRYINGEWIWLKNELY